jgi:hypothetical protein
MFIGDYWITMIKRFCDCCEKEITSHNDRHEFSWKCHLTSVVKGHAMNCYEIIDHETKEGHWTSGRNDAVELCSKCYNEIVILSVKKYFELKEKNNGPI